MKKSFGIYAVAWAAVLGLFNVITFVIPAEDKFDTLFWIAYALITLFFVVQLACTYFIFKPDALEKKFYNIPLVSVSVTALIAMLVVGGICMGVKAIPDWLGIILCCVVVALNIISYARAAAGATIISAVDEKIKTQTFFIKSLSADAQALSARAQGDEMNALVHKIYEAIRYSDPMSNEMLADVESDIGAQFKIFSKAVSDNNSELASASADELLALISSRNAKCKILK